MARIDSRCHAEEPEVKPSIVSGLTPRSSNEKEGVHAGTTIHQIGFYVHGTVLRVISVLLDLAEHAHSPHGASLIFLRIMNGCDSIRCRFRFSSNTLRYNKILIMRKIQTVYPLCLFFISNQLRHKFLLYRRRLCYSIWVEQIKQKLRAADDDVSFIDSTMLIRQATNVISKFAKTTY